MFSRFDANQVCSGVGGLFQLLRPGSVRQEAAAPERQVGDPRGVTRLAAVRRFGSFHRKIRQRSEGVADERPVKRAGEFPDDIAGHRAFRQ
ncbi:hypothetical protein SDC9_171940 [bioreactor metagenome]|uniref:Uncharacterized protein n=1 Tax=bioreactor metagenome TaxID=1076179 RepID=A0A645GC96_9ZZZZ